jgi:hypothetical protein
METEILARKALEILKSKWGLPQKGFLAGGSLANTIWELHSGNPAVVNDLDIFLFEGKIDNQEEISREDSLFRFKEEDVRYYEDYTGMCWNSYTKDFYTITSSEKKGIFNEIGYKASTDEQGIILNSFDINATRVGYSIEEDKFYITKDFEDFLNTGELKICNIQTPSHTAIRIAKKSKELNAKLDEMEFKLISYCLSRCFSDVNKFRFKERYFEMFQQNKNLLEPYFKIERDKEIEEFLKLHKNVDTELYGLTNTDYFLPIKEQESKDYDILSLLETNNIFNDDNLGKLHTSKDFLFYIRNVFGTEMEKIWEKVYYFYTDCGYVDMEVSKEDLDLLRRLGDYAPNSIENLKGMKMSKQLSLVKKLLDIYKEDPIIAIAILEKGNASLYDNLDDECNQLLLELSVRKEIVNDTKNKVGNILSKELDS